MSVTNKKGGVTNVTPGVQGFQKTTKGQKTVPKQRPASRTEPSNAQPPYTIEEKQFFAEGAWVENKGWRGQANEDVYYVSPARRISNGLFQQISVAKERDGTYTAIETLNEKTRVYYGGGTHSDVSSDLHAAQTVNLASFQEVREAVAGFRANPGFSRKLKHTKPKRDTLLS